MPPDVQQNPNKSEAAPAPLPQFCICFYMQLSAKVSAKDEQGPSTTTNKAVAQEWGQEIKHPVSLCWRTSNTLG